MELASIREKEILCSRGDRVHTPQSVPVQGSPQLPCRKEKEPPHGDIGSHVPNAVDYVVE